MLCITVYSAYFMNNALMLINSLNKFSFQLRLTVLF